MTKIPVRQSRHMQRFSKLAGPLQPLGSSRKGPVRYISMLSKEQSFYKYWARIVAYGALVLTFIFAFVLFQPKHWIVILDPQSPNHIGNWIMLVCLIFLQIFVILGTISATRSTVKAKNPLPVRPLGGLRVAFVTTRAPGEPIDMVQHTLRAAVKVTYSQGKVDCWLLDETNDTALRHMCKKMGVKYFTRHGVAKWNTTKQNNQFLTKIANILAPKRYPVYAINHLRHNPFYASKTKHGNFNAWIAYLVEKKLSYDILAGVDTDHVPEPNYLQRMLGYFRDSDVAYVVGPQVYANYAPGLSGLVARWAESQASFFQSTIQRAGNDSESAMFVGTNYAVRLSALRQVGGFQPCITEDMATGLAIHAHRNLVTGNRWKSVYTPDVLALGEGPNYWAPYFTQQWRWAAGTFDTWRNMVWRHFYKLSPKAMIHYFLILTYYPVAALTWLIAIISCMTYLITGATAMIAPWGQFISLYAMTLVMQMSLYFWNRRHNVSPHEQEGSYGIPGMALSSLTAPVYLSAFVGVILNKSAHFVVTKKGSSENPDWFAAFQLHLKWAAVLVIGIIYGILRHHWYPAMLLCAGILLVICFTPFILGMMNVLPERLRKQVAETKLIAKEV